MSTHETLLKPNSLAQLAAWLGGAKSQRVLLVRGEKSYRLSGAESLIAPMLAGVPHKEFVRPSLLVKAEDLELLLGDLRSFNPDLIIAIGGGAVIDSAKALTLLARSSFSAAELPQVDLTEVDTVPLVAVPTTAGSGSEATCFAALYVEGRKYSIKAPGLLPRLAIVDSNLTHSLPAYETACSGIDALCQAIESHWSRKSSEESRRFSRKAIELAFWAITSAVQDGNSDARKQMIEAANLSGKAINLSGTTGPHAFSYGFTYDFGIAHGHAVALTILQFMRFNSDFDNYKVEERGNAVQTRERLAEISTALGCTSIPDAIRVMDARLIECGLNLRFADLGIQSRELTALCEKVDPVRLSNNPRSVSKEQYQQFFS